MFFVCVISGWVILEYKVAAAIRLLLVFGLHSIRLMDSLGEEKSGVVGHTARWHKILHVHENTQDKCKVVQRNEQARNMSF